MEAVGVKALNGIYRGCKVLVTGHTGFKGSWLCLWLQSMGAEVVGLALDPVSEPNHWDLLGLTMSDHRVDIRDEAAVRSVVADERPEIVFHLAAQPLVRRSYVEPVATWSTNVLGTVHVLDALRHTTATRAAVIVTSDKCYENRDWPWGYRETDRLGGHDAYSASKAAAELVAASYRAALLHSAGTPLVATARGGNVIGGGDWSEDRLVPDLVRAMMTEEPLLVRSPAATRPWQHVLDCLSGYLVLGQRLLEGDSSAPDAWNFGPDADAVQTVERVLEDFGQAWPQLRWRTDSDQRPHEANLLKLDSSKARASLGWRPVWDYATAVLQTATWYSDWLRNGRVSSREQLDLFLSDANAR